MTFGYLDSTTNLNLTSSDSNLSSTLILVKETSTPTPEEKGVPGFEAVFVIVGLLAMAYLLRRRK